MRLPLVIALAGGLAGLTTRLDAQTCLGEASFASRPMRVGAGYNVSDQVKNYGVNFAAGAPDGLFGSGGLSQTKYDGSDNTGNVVGVGAGYAMNLTPTNSVQFCPVASFNYQSGPNFSQPGGDVSNSFHAFGFGGSIGGVVPASPTFDLVPFVGASYVTSSASSSIAGFSSSSSLDYGILAIGAGFVLNRNVTFQPSVSVPFGIDNAKSTFQFAFSYNFGSGATKR